ncbi:MAG: tetratricopeptide repeat protein [Leptospiraceae bacterium]|nr:tetratricopeptide repeat protein [Leptospiraceae bacterium]
MFRTTLPRRIIFHTVLVGLIGFSAGSLWANEYYRQGKLAYSAGNVDQALNLFQKSWEVQTSNGNPLFYMGLIYYERSQYEQGIQYFRRAVELRMDTDLREKAYWKLVLFYKTRKDWENLLIYSEKFLAFRDTPQVRSLRDMAEQNRDPRMERVNALMRSAKAHQDDGDEAAAARDYESALRIRSDYHPARWALALIQMRQDNYRSAEHHLQVLMNAEPDSWEYHYKAAVCNYHLSNYDTALDLLEKARAKNPDPGESFNFYVNYMEGLIYLEQQNYPESYTHLSKAREIKNNPGLAGRLSRAAWETEKLEEADRFSREALSQDATDRDGLLVQMHLQIHAGNQSQALVFGKRLLTEVEKDDQPQTAPRYTPVLLYYGKRSAQNSDWTEAIRAYERVNVHEMMRMHREESARDNPRYDYLRDYNFYYGISLMHARLYDRAINVLQKLNDELEGRYYLARTYALSGNTNQAMRHLRTAAAVEEKTWDRAANDSAFQELMRKDAEFNAFIRNRGKEPEPEPQRQTESESEAAPEREPAARNQQR